jgi:hypothetical protein
LPRLVHTVILLLNLYKAHFSCLFAITGTCLLIPHASKSTSAV